MKTVDRNHLPQDIPTLHAIIGDLLDIIEEQKKIISFQQHKIEELQAIVSSQQHLIDDQAAKIERLTARTDHLEKLLYGKRSERQPRSSCSTSKNKSEGRHNHGRRPLPKDLPRAQQNYEVPPSERICSECGHFLSKISDVISEQLECIPTQLYVIEHRRAKYACKHCQSKVVVARMPLQAIDKGLPGPGLLAEVLVAKYQEHMPLYRQSQRFKRLGLELPRSTLCNWVMMASDLLEPLVDRMQQHLLAGAHIFTDDTPIRVAQRAVDQGKIGRFWIYTNKGHQHYPACCIYQYTPDRKGHHPQQFLAQFNGYLQKDAYAGYHSLCYDEAGRATAIIPAACWAHCRRYFFESAEGTAVDSLAYQGLAFITRLYALEAQARVANLSEDDLYQWRCEKAVPILNEFWDWLQLYKSKVLPKSSLAQAINYTFNNWEALQTYLQQGFLEIDNNRAERGIRPIALGRKNYLFVGNNRGGHAAAIIYSLIETGKIYNINTAKYLQDVLHRISTHPQSKIDDLLPYNWSPLNNQNEPPLNLNLALKTAA